MLQGRGEFEWNMTSSLMALQINMNCKQKVKPNDFNPYVLQHEGKNVIKLNAKESEEVLKRVFLKGNK